MAVHSVLIRLSFGRIGTLFSCATTEKQNTFWSDYRHVGYFIEYLRSTAFLRACIFSTVFRPVELHEFVRIGQRMWKVLPRGELESNAELPPNRLSKADPDGLCQLLIGVIPQHSVLIFCPTKKICESVATLIAECVPEPVRKSKLEEKKKVLASLKEDCEGQISPVLENTIMAGIAYHHSGLTHEERKHIEAAYTEGVLCVICATSTLAAGVNMPAKRVIIKIAQRRARQMPLDKEEGAASRQ